MPDVFDADSVDGVFGDIFGEVADAFQAARYEDEFQHGSDRVGVGGHEGGDRLGEVFVHLVEFLVAWLECAGERGVAIGIGQHGIRKHGHGVLIHGLDVRGVGNCGEGAEFAGTAGDAHGLVGRALDIDAGFHGCDDIAEVGCDGVEAEHDVHAFGIDFDFEAVDLLVINNDGVAPVFIAFEKALACIFQAALKEARHEEHVFAQIFEGGFKVCKDVAGRFHLLGLMWNLKCGIRNVVGDPLSRLGWLQSAGGGK